MEERFDILQTLKDNKSDVTSCDFGGNYLLAVGSSDKSVRVLEWKIGLGFVDVSYSPMQSHKYGVTWVRFSPQGTMLASSSVDGTTILWNVKTGTKIYTMVQATKCSVRRCEFTPNSTKLITAGDDGVFCFWDLVHRTHIRKHWLHSDEESCVQGLAISPDSEYLLTGDSGGLLKLWSLSNVDAETLKQICSLKNVHDGVTCCEFSGDFKITGREIYQFQYIFATCGLDGSIKLWNLVVTRNSSEATSNGFVNCEVFLQNELLGHECDVLNIRFNSNGMLLASTGLDKTVKMWQVKTGECLENFLGHARYGNCCAFSKDSSLLATGSNDRTVVIWDLNHNFNLDSELIKKCNTNSHFTGEGSMRRMAEEMVVHQSENESNRLQPLKIIKLHSAVNTVHFHDNNLLATAGGDKLVSLWERAGESSFELQSTLEGQKYSINQVEISPCGTKLVSCAMNGVIAVWDLQMGLSTELQSPQGINSIRTSRFSPNSEFIAAAGDDQMVFLWDAKSLEFVKTLQEHRDAITSVSFTADSKLLASTCCAGDLIVFDMETNQYYASKDDVHDLGASCCDFSHAQNPTGTDDAFREYVLATSGNDSLIKVWKVASNQITEWKELSTHGGNVIYVRFSPQVLHLLASCATDYTTRLWNVVTTNCLHVFDHHTSIVTTCAFSQDSSLLATGSLDKTVIIWTLSKEDGLDRSNFIQNSRKLLQYWTSSDVSEWLEELGLVKSSLKVKNTSLNGQILLASKINNILDVIDIEEERNEVALHVFWARCEAKRNPTESRQQLNAPHQFLCPITHEIMTDPVTCSDGFTYERGAIIEWLLCGRYTSPMTNEPLRDLKFKTNAALRTSILKYLYGEEVTD